MENPEKPATQGIHDEKTKQSRITTPNVLGTAHAQINTNKTWALLQTTGGKNEPNIIFYVEIVTNITTRNTNIMSNTDHAKNPEMN